MNHPLQCRCGTLKGYVVRPGMAKRAVCYCKDCQAFAHFLKRADTVLDERGGTAIVATVAKQVHFTQGLEALACMSLSDRGLLRWYASCCNTPIGNTPRDFKTPYVGLIESCLKSNSPSLEDSFGPVRMVINTRSARGHVKSTPVSNLVAMLGIIVGDRNSPERLLQTQSLLWDRNGHAGRASSQPYQGRAGASHKCRLTSRSTRTPRRRRWRAVRSAPVSLVR